MQEDINEFKEEEEKEEGRRKLHTWKSTCVIDIYKMIVPFKCGCSRFLHLGMLAHCHGLLDGFEPSLMTFVICAFPSMTSKNVSCEKGPIGTLNDVINYTSALLCVTS